MRRLSVSRPRFRPERLPRLTQITAIPGTCPFHDKKPHVHLTAAAWAPGHIRRRGWWMRGRTRRRNLDRPEGSPGVSTPDARRPLPRHRPPDRYPGAVLPRTTLGRTLETGDALDAKLGDLWGLFGGAVWKAPEHPAEGVVSGAADSGRRRGRGVPSPISILNPTPAHPRPLSGPPKHASPIPYTTRNRERP
jgi:hypothetical protein